MQHGPGRHPFLFGPSPSLRPILLFLTPRSAEMTSVSSCVDAGSSTLQLGQRTHSGNWVLKTGLVVEMRDLSQLLWDLFRSITLWWIATDNVNAGCYESSPVYTFFKKWMSDVCWSDLRENICLFFFIYIYKRQAPLIHKVKYFTQ